jgi:glycosyltransferase involved in cell wall biosynthesis
MVLSVIIPVYKGAKTITRLVVDLNEKLAHLPFEIILVNDGSPDHSEEVCTNLASQHHHITFISLRKNFGEFNAVMCGLNHAKGSYSVIIDDDFQNPPSEIMKLLSKAQEHNYDVVYSFYPEKKHSIFRNLGSFLVNKMTTYLFNKPDNLYLSSFKLLKREIVREICQYKGPYPYIDALIFRVTHNVGKVMVTHLERTEGASNYTLRKLIALFMSILFGYSLLPVRLILFSGILITFLNLLLVILTLCHIFSFSSVFLLVGFIGGLQITALGILGEYLAKTYLTQNGLPQFVIKSTTLKHGK